MAGGSRLVIQALLLAVVVATVLSTVSGRATDARATNLPVPAGDANCSSDVNAIDAALLLQYGAGLVSTLPCYANADTNADARIDSLDAALILQYGAGLLATLPPPIFHGNQCQELVESTVVLVASSVLGPPLSSDGHALVKGSVEVGVLMCLNSPLVACGKALDKWEAVQDEDTLLLWAVDVAVACDVVLPPVVPQH